MYGERGRLTLDDRPGGGVVATVRLPYHEFTAPFPDRADD
jgi:hypothetical protein